MVNKILGYVLFGIGAVSLGLSFPTVRTLAKIPIPAVLTDMYLMVGGAIILFIGAYLAFGNDKSHKIPKEVPIYEGQGKHRQIVGYQRHSK